MLTFDFLENGLGIISPQHFVNDFLKNRFLMLYSINPFSVCVIWCGTQIPVIFPCAQQGGI